jgi:hypothetical protein
MNLIKALKEYKPIELNPVVFKLTYNPDTFIVTGATCEDTNEPWIEITREQYDSGIQFKKLKIVNGKIQEITKENLKKKL